MGNIIRQFDIPSPLSSFAGPADRKPANGSFGSMSGEAKCTMRIKVQDACKGLLEALGIDLNDPNVKDTPRRMADMYINELLRGRYTSPPEVTDFPNQRHFDELYTVGPISITSLCSHHFLPFTGNCWIGVLPAQDKPILGLSKFARIAQWIFARPQIQEEATIQLADLLESKCQPQGLGIVVQASHQCMVLRGVKAQDALMTTSVMRGMLRENATLRQEFLGFVGQK